MDGVKSYVPGINHIKMRSLDERIHHETAAPPADAGSMDDLLERSPDHGPSAALAFGASAAGMGVGLLVFKRMTGDSLNAVISAGLVGTMLAGAIAAAGILIAERWKHNAGLASGEVPKAVVGNVSDAPSDVRDLLTRCLGYGSYDPSAMAHEVIGAYDANGNGRIALEGPGSETKTTFVETNKRLLMDDETITYHYDAARMLVAANADGNDNVSEHELATYFQARTNTVTEQVDMPAGTVLYVRDALTDQDMAPVFDLVDYLGSSK